MSKITAYKAFAADWTCKGFRFEVGETYHHNGDIAMYRSGFHACEVPFDCWNYYPGAMRFARVELSGVSDEGGEDSKRVAESIKISAALTLREFIREQASTVVDMCSSTDETECAAATGYYGHAGDGGHAAATGNGGHAAAVGNRGHAAAMGYDGHAAAMGNGGHAAAMGNGGHAVAAGYDGHAATAGYNGHAAATGNYGHAVATGDGGHAAAAGDNGHATTAGNHGHAAATGNAGHATATGHYGHAAATGAESHAMATGYNGHAATTGNGGHAAVNGRNAIAASIGRYGTAKAEAGGAIVLAAYGDDGNLVAVRASLVGENGVQPGKTYRLSTAGEFVEIEVTS